MRKHCSQRQQQNATRRRDFTDGRTGSQLGVAGFNDKLLKRRRPFDRFVSAVVKGNILVREAVTNLNVSNLRQSHASPVRFISSVDQHITSGRLMGLSVKSGWEQMLVRRLKVRAERCGARM